MNTTTYLYMKRRIELEYIDASVFPVGLIVCCTITSLICEWTNSFVIGCAALVVMSISLSKSSRVISNINKQLRELGENV